IIADIEAEGFEVMVTDGGSSDNSIEIAEKKGVVILERPGMGKGFGMKQAMNYAFENGKEIIVFIDCDRTYPVDRIKDLAAAMSDADMVIGVRDSTGMSIKSKFLNALLRMMMNILFLTNLRDHASGFRALRIEKFIHQLKTDGMDLEIEITGFAIKNKYRIKEIEVDYLNRVGESKLLLTDIIKALFTIFKTRF